MTHAEIHREIMQWLAPLAKSNPERWADSLLAAYDPASVCIELPAHAAVDGHPHEYRVPDSYRRDCVGEDPDDIIYRLREEVDALRTECSELSESLCDALRAFQDYLVSIGLPSEPVSANSLPGPLQDLWRALW